MDSLIDRIHYAMYDLSRRSWNNDPLIYTTMKTFEDEIDFLARFVDCIGHRRSNALELAPHLSTVVTKVEALVQKIGAEFLEKMNRYKWASALSFVSFNLVGSTVKEKKVSSKWMLAFDNWVRMMFELKPDVAFALNNLSISSIQCRFSARDNFSELGSFLINTYEHVKDVQGSFLAHFRDPKKIYLEICQMKPPPYLETLLLYLEENDLIKYPEVEAFLTKLGSSFISAELLCCQWWFCSDSTLDLETGKEGIRAIFEDLERMIWLTNPEFVDVILGVLKNMALHKFLRFFTIAEYIVNRYINFRGTFSKIRNSTRDNSDGFFNVAKSVVNRRMPLPLSSSQVKNVLSNTLGSELISLVTYVLVVLMRDEENAMAKMFLFDTKQLLLETASLHQSLQHENVTRNQLQKIWLVKIEMLLRTQIAGSKTNSIYKVTSEIDALTHIVGLISKSLASDGSASTRILNQILMLMEQVVKEAAMIRKSEPIALRILLLETLFIKGEFLFIKLHDNLSGSFKGCIESIHEGFKLMMPSAINQPGGNFNSGQTGFAAVESVANRTIAIYNQILAQQNTSEEMLINMKASSVPDLLDEIKLIMKELKGSYLGIQMPVFPYTNAVGFSHSLLSKLRELLNYEMDLAESIISKEQISEIIELLHLFQPFLQDSSEGNISQELKHLCIRALNMTYEAEYLIDSIISRKEADKCHNMIWLYHFLQEIRDLKRQLSQNQLKRTNIVKVHMISRETTPDIDEDVVSLPDEEQSIIDGLMGGFGKLYSVSIVGMPGIGKTTLAKKVYNSPEVVTHFQIRAWCCVSEVYRRRDVLLEILSHMIATTADIMEMADEDLEFKLYKILMTKRYLIVLDDVWSSDVLDDLVRRFPDNGDNSRILITSRTDSVAVKANPDADPHHLRQFYNNESWFLLQKKIFHEKPCPDELKVIGEEIAASCKGLPLAVIAIAGLLQRIERQYNRWKDISESLTSKIVDDPQEQWRRILELSYENLPDCLKACFLYFGAFLEDQDIPTWKLMQLWIAEGFVPETELKSMEDLAEDYLMDLIGRNLVVLSKERSLGGAKACRIHDVLRKLCQSKAKEDKFLQVIMKSNASNNAALHDLDYVFGDPTSSVVKYEDHRLCFCSKRKHFIHSRPLGLGPHVRSLLCFANGDEDPKYPYDISFISRNFSFLKVLDLECINMGNAFEEDILLLLHLKYLAVAGYIHSIPSSIVNLRNLETFIVKGLLGKVHLPYELWFLRRLRHIRVRGLAALDFDGDSSQLQPACLVSVSSLILPSGEETDCFLKKCQNLRKLKGIFLRSPLVVSNRNFNQFPNLEVLDELESLKVTYYGWDVGFGDFSFPSNLKKLTLSNFRLPWDKISVISGLQQLEVLKLQSQAFVGEEWEMVEGVEFLQLKYLTLENLDFAKWNANSDNLPKLKKLVLRSCKNLEIPEEILEVPTLQIIDVQWCGESVEKSARQIREGGDEKLKVFINFAELQIL